MYNNLNSRLISGVFLLSAVVAAFLTPQGARADDYQSSISAVPVHSRDYQENDFGPTAFGIGISDTGMPANATSSALHVQYPSLIQAPIALSDSGSIKTESYRLEVAAQPNEWE